MKIKLNVNDILYHKASLEYYKVLAEFNST